MRMTHQLMKKTSMDAHCTLFNPQSDTARHVGWTLPLFGPLVPPPSRSIGPTPINNRMQQRIRSADSFYDGLGRQLNIIVQEPHITRISRE